MNMEMWPLSFQRNDLSHSFASLQETTRKLIPGFRLLNIIFTFIDIFRSNSKFYVPYTF